MLLIIREMQIKTTVRYHLIQVRMAIIKKSTNNNCWRACGKTPTVVGNVNWYSHYGQQYDGSLKHLKQSYHQFSSVSQLCLTLCNPMDCSTPGLPVHHQFLEIAQTHVHQIGDAILCHPLFLPSIFPSIRVSSKELVLHIRQRKYWSFSFNISPSNE